MLSKTILIIRQIWRGHVKFAPCVPFSKSPRVITSASKSSKPYKESATSKNLKERARAQRIIDYIFGSGEFPHDDIPDIKNVFGTHKGQLAQIVAPQVHEKNDAKEQTVRAVKRQPAQKIPQNLTDGYEKATNVGAQKPKVAIAKDISPAVSRSNPNIFYDEYGQMTGAERADAAKVRVQEAERLEEMKKPRVVPVYPGHIQRLYYDPYGKDVNKPQSKICKEINNILTKHEEEQKKGIAPTCNNTESDHESLNKCLLKIRLRADDPSRKVKHLSRFQPHGRPFSLHEKLQANLKKHMTATKTEPASDHRVYINKAKNARLARKQQPKREPNTWLSIDELNEKTIENTSRGKLYRQQALKPIKSINETDALISDISCKGVPLIDEDISKRVADISQKNTKEKHGEPHSLPVNASTAGTIMYSETSSSAATVETSSAAKKNETSRFENPKDLDVDIEAVSTGRQPAKSCNLHVLNLEKQKPVNAIRETLDIAKTVVEESNNVSSAKCRDVSFDLGVKNLIECPISKIGEVSVKLEKNKSNSEVDPKCKLKADEVILEKTHVDEERVQQKNITNTSNITQTRMNAKPENKIELASHKETVDNVLDGKAEASKENMKIVPREIITEPVTEEIKTPKFKTSIVPAPIRTEANLDVSQNPELDSKVGLSPIIIESGSPPHIEHVGSKLSARVDQSSVPEEPEEDLTRKLEKIRRRPRNERMKNLQLSVHSEVESKPNALFWKKPTDHKSSHPPPQRICPPCPPYRPPYSPPSRPPPCSRPRCPCCKPCCFPCPPPCVPSKPPPCPPSQPPRCPPLSAPKSPKKSDPTKCPPKKDAPEKNAPKKKC